jgi:hypothetical protein
MGSSASASDALARRNQQARDQLQEIEGELGVIFQLVEHAADPSRCPAARTAAG